MPKLVVVTKTEKPTPPAECTDWTLCVLCQRDKVDKVLCPANSTRSHYKSGYDIFYNNLAKFQEIGSVALDVNPARLDDGNGILQTLQEHKAWWHKTCYNQFDSYHLDRAYCSKRKSTGGDEESSPVKTRASVGPLNSSVRLCFFCDQEGKEKLHVASTMGIDEGVRRAATLLNDRKLLAKFANTDMRAQDALYSIISAA